MGQARTAVPPILAFDELDSTNAEARRRAEAGEAGPLWISARRQSSGRGRRGRAWDTGAGNLAATLLTTTSKRPAEAAEVAFVAALAAAELAASQVPAPLVRLKWPNDVLVAGDKAAGILVESGARGAGDLERTSKALNQTLGALPDRQTGPTLAGSALWLAIGVGVNLSSAPAGTERPATSLQAHLRPDLSQVLAPEAALQRLAESFQRWMETWLSLGFAPVRAAWTDLAYGLGQHCTARLGHETVQGVAEGLDEDGALRLRLADGGGLRRITAGDVFFAEAAA